ncbi:hypothetical protein MGMO_73c00150 [Methyloglobulus morosus KoM1]|uniref:Uncharacterized protein n=1 Tax=Methyloglobulus morosus KoM1 TaxID=1116472 RepID=V5DXN0_9GAMM|nr:putative DNA binding domain-containing protein [Methyloglobulus morosus]ESS72076.1 hypothetical protein MGMO_73c00150 [Methyloglobulus morosus KoM1]
MLNRDINSRFEDWLISPNESLDFEVKQWLDMTNRESHEIVAKALIALENHGGGFLLFGYKEDVTKKLVPDTTRPASMEPYLTDAINAILKKCAEPSFHVVVTLQVHPMTKEEYPLVRVSGKSKVPVRSDSSTPNGSLKHSVYYIRGPGPESRAPNNAAEWDSLLRRSLQNQREEIFGLLRTLLPTAPDLLGGNPNDEHAVLHAFAEASTGRWANLNSNLPEDNPSKIALGYFSFAARILGASKNATAKEIIEANQSARRYTGWPAFVSLHQEATKPRLIDGCIEAWLAHINYPDVGHADFWRIDAKGNFFLLRGYQEDSLDPEKGFGNPGILFEATLPVWRLGEFLLRVVDLGDNMFEPGYEVLVECTWNGLAGRHLFVHNMRRFISGGYTATEKVVTTKGRFSQQLIRELLPDTVKVLTHSLYEHFDFFVPPDTFYSEELGEMTKNRY